MSSNADNDVDIVGDNLYDSAGGWIDGVEGNGDGVGKDDNDEDWEDDNLSRLSLEL